MNPLAYLLAILNGLACGSLALISFVLLCGAAWDHAVERRRKGSLHHCEDKTQTLQAALNGLSAGIEQIRQGPPPGPVPGTRRPPLSLPKRTQALRMHRRGDPPEKIAATLDIPIGEVDLLLKVHRIVISNI